MFWIKKLLGTLLAPLPMGFLLMGVGFFFIRRGKRRKLGRLLFCVGLGLPLISSNHGFSNLLIHQLEKTYPSHSSLASADSPAPVYLAVLGGGHAHNPELPHLSQLGVSSRARLVEAVRLARVYPDAQLILCGPLGRAKAKTHAEVLAFSAAELGIDQSRIIQIPDGRDTHDEIQGIGEIAESRRVGIVTSAWHMPRAMGMAKKTGLNAVACPADYMAPATSVELTDWFKFHPGSLDTTTRAIREFLGLTWSSLRGQI